MNEARSQKREEKSSIYSIPFIRFETKTSQKSSQTLKRRTNGSMPKRAAKYNSRVSFTVVKEKSIERHYNHFGQVMCKNYSLSNGSRKHGVIQMSKIIELVKYYTIFES